MKLRRPSRPESNSSLAKRRSEALPLIVKYANSYLPDLSSLRQPGGVEKSIELLRERINLDDRRQRDAIDAQVQYCHVVARYLHDNPTSQQTAFGGAWTKFWLRNRENPSASLRFVCRQAYSDQKRGSFYYRATRKLFEDGTLASAIPGRVTAGGGYKQLAEENVRSPRTRKAEDESEECSTSDYADDDEPQGPSNSRSTERISSNSTTSSKRDDSPKAERALVLVAELGQESESFKHLPIGCRAFIDVEILSRRGNEWRVLMMAAVKWTP